MTRVERWSYLLVIGGGIVVGIVAIFQPLLRFSQILWPFAAALQAYLAMYWHRRAT